MLKYINMNNNLPNPPFPNEPQSIVPLLPMDLRIQIYKDHLWFEAEKKPLCDEILEWFLHDEQAQRLNINPIMDRIQDIIECKHSMKYLCKKDKDIYRCYDHHYIKEQKNFDLLNKLDSFILSILMYKYH